MGEKYNALNQKGLTSVNHVEEKFCFQGEKTYCTAPFFWTDTGFGLYVDTEKETAFSFEENDIEVKLPDDADVVLFSGTPEEIVAEYMGLFGKAVLPPDWAFSVWISANRWNTQAEAELQIEKLEKYGFKAGVIVLEAWSDEATFYIFNGAKYKEVPNGRALSYEDFDFSNSVWPDPKGMIEKLHKAGLHLLLWQVPVFKKQGTDEVLNAQNELDRADATERSLCVMNADGTPYTIPEGHWFSGSMIPDFTRKETVDKWFSKRRYLLDIGVDGFKTDGGEFVYSDDLKCSDGSGGSDLRNRYSRDYTSAYTSFIGRERALFSRAGFSGQHTVPMHWAGDQQSQNCELRSALRAGLSAAATGIPFWGFDIAGFAGPLPTLDLYRRATQMACFCPVMQWHSEPDGGQFRELMPGGEGNNERSPWNMADAYGCPGFVDEMRYLHELRERLLPYILDTAKASVSESKPMMRPLVYSFPEDGQVVSIEDEYMFGDSLLVAPLLEEEAKGRKVYLPQGKWRCLYEDLADECGQVREFDGGQEIYVEFDGRIPVFVLGDADVFCKKA